MVEPVVVIGMHRSGTSIMAMLLDQLGVFMGSSRDQNYESTFFLKKTYRQSAEAARSAYSEQYPTALRADICK